jgi:uncharacterized protein (DUF1778 family)
MATAVRNQKSARLGSRCTQAQKIKVQRAAELCGNSVTDFTINTLMEKADKVIKQHCVIDLSMKDQMAFAEALLNPPSPNKALLKAKHHHQELIERK